MKRITIITTLLLATISAFAQEDFNIHYQWLDDYARNCGVNTTHCMNPRRVPVPDIPGYHTYKADLHMHTIFSDARVAPEMRVYEAWNEDLDILAITDHHPSPRTKYDQGDLNAGCNEAEKIAKQLGFKLIRGFEITDNEPVGHINVLFVNDLNRYRMKSPNDPAEADRIIKLAQSEDAVIFTNHPGWPDENSTLSDFVESRLADGTFCGIEVFNHKEFYPMAIDHALKYGVSMLANTDSHYPTWFQFDQKDEHRDMTLIFAKDKSDDAIKEALRAGRTIAWANNILAGREDLLRTFVHSCIKLVFMREEEGMVRFRLLNESDIPFFLVGSKPQETIRIPAGGYAETMRRKSALEESYKVMNTYVSSTKHLEIPISFLLQGDTEVCMPNVSESGIHFSDEGLAFSLSCNEGNTYYSLDGSEPGESSMLYDGGEILLTEPATVKAVTISNGIRSKVHERRMAFSNPVKCKGRKHGVKYSYYENDDILSTKDVEAIGVLKKTGTYDNLVITEGIGKDHFGFVFKGFIEVPETGLYGFTLTTNDGSDLYIGGELACDNDQHQGQRTNSGSIYLKKGFHPYKIRYFEGYGGESFALSWTLPGTATSTAVPKERLFLE